jgi:hypothetical protein
MKEGIDVSKRGEMDLLGKIKVKELRKTDFNVVKSPHALSQAYGYPYALDVRRRVRARRSKGNRRRDIAAAVSGRQ